MQVAIVVLLSIITLFLFMIMGAVINCQNYLKDIKDMNVGKIFGSGSGQ